MIFSIIKSIEILDRTPQVLFTLLDGISEDWTSPNEGGETWSVFDVVGHLVHGDKTDWMVRMEQILSDPGKNKFSPFDRFAQIESSKGKTLKELLEEFVDIRKFNMDKLHRLNIKDEDLSKTGIHPSFGEVTLAQLLATWVAHDLDHISQISRVMAKQYAGHVGPWIEYLKILRS